MDANDAGTLRDARPPAVAGLAAAGFDAAKEVGRGGFGVVYRCSQEGLDRAVAVKVLITSLADDRARFVREQQAMGRLTGHPNIVAVFQVGELDNGLPFLVMPFCEQGSVQDRITRLAELPLDEVLRIGVKLAGALASAHDLGIVHRDVKPANILLTEYGEPALCDFGIARIGGAFQTATGVFVGSPAFMAPEVIGGGPASAASDVYGLGATLFTALTGHAPFERRDGEQVVAQFLRIAGAAFDVRGYGIADDVAAVISSAMARDPGRRPSALELGQQLQQVQADHGLVVDEMALRDAIGNQRRVGGCSRSGSATVRTPPEAAPGPRRTGNLPALMATLVGRGEQLVQLRELVAGSRLVTVTGIGGIGKTTLATHAAHQLAPDFADGVWLVELAELRDATLLTQVVSTALGVRDQLGRSLSEALVGFLSPRRLMLVLDNCEHLVDEVADLAETLLRDCASLKILATSREALDIGGESVLALSPLPCPPSGDEVTPRALADYEAAQLFVERVRAGMPEFALTQANAAAVGRICARLEGLPLALELAAARVRIRSVEQIAQDLSDRFALLTRGRRGAPVRQRTLAGCMDWSYQLCSSTEQQVWARLSVFAGGFDLPAAAHLCGGQLDTAGCLDTLSALVDKSIVVSAEQDDRSMRFRLLDTVREYGQAHLDGAEHDLMRRRHAQWYQQLTTAAYARCFGPDLLEWLKRVGTEMPNIRAALRFNLDNDPAAALQMATNVFMFWYVSGMISESRQWLDLVLSATGQHPTTTRIRGLGYAVLAAAVQADLPAAQASAAEVRKLLRGVDDPDLQAWGDHADGQIALFSGDVARARDCFQRALNGTDDYEVQTSSMFCLGAMQGFLGEHDDALRWQEQLLALAESRGDPYARAGAQNGLGTSLWRRGEVERAEKLMREALHTASVFNDPRNGAHCLEALAWIVGSRHDSRRAVVLLAAASALGAAAGAPVNPIPEMAAWHDECESRARAELGSAQFEAAWAHGNALSFEQAAAFALADTADQPIG